MKVQCAAILAGGLGTRLRSVISDRPKVMATVDDRPFLTYLLDQLTASGIKRTVICTGYMSEIIKNYFGNIYCGMELVYSDEDEPLGTGGALRNAAHLFNGDKVIAMNGDSWCDCDLSKFELTVNDSGLVNGIILAEVRDIARFGEVETDTSEKVIRFIEKGVKSGPGWINAGIYMISIDRIMTLPINRQISLELELIPLLLNEGLFGFRTSGEFIDIGVPEEFQRAQTLLKISKNRNGDL